MRQFDTPEKLKAAFGSETPSREDIKKALDRQQDVQNVLSSVGQEAVDAARKNGRLWPVETKAAAEYLANEDNYNRVQGAKDESYRPWTRGDWVSADKIKACGKDTFKVTLEEADAKIKRRDDAAKEVDDLGKKLDAKYGAPKPEAGGKPVEAGKPSEAEAKLKTENDALKKQLAEQDERMKRMEALLEQLTKGTKPAEQPKKEEAAKPPTEAAKPPVQPNKEEAAKPPVEAKKPVETGKPAETAKPPEQPKKTEVAPPPKNKAEVDWAAKERENEQKLLEYLKNRK
jgi:hypothetical protein